MCKRALNFIFDNSLLLIAGAGAGLIWANLDYHSYEAFLNFPLFRTRFLGQCVGSSCVVNVHFLINEFLMMFFFAVAGREVFEAMQPGGPLSNPRLAATPLVCAAGGMIMPALLYVIGAAVAGQLGPLHAGWAVPTATDIVFSYMVARAIFGRDHPAVSFLLLLAIADDAGGLVILTIFYPQGPVHFGWLLLAAAAVGVGLVSWRVPIRAFLWYLLVPGMLSWYGFARSGLHPALALLPIIPVIPHVHIAKHHPGWNFLREINLEAFEFWLKRPVEVILGLFGLANTGVIFNQVGMPTILVAGGLILGKPLGIFLSGWLGVKGFKLRLPEGLNWQSLLVVGCTAGIGFTVAIFVATVAFPNGDVQAAAKMGALVSFGSGLLAWPLAKAFGIKPWQSNASPKD